MPSHVSGLVCTCAQRLALTRVRLAEGGSRVKLRWWLAPIGSGRSRLPYSPVVHRTPALPHDSNSPSPRPHRRPNSHRRRLPATSAATPAKRATRIQGRHAQGHAARPGEEPVHAGRDPRLRELPRSGVGGTLTMMRRQYRQFGQIKPAEVNTTCSTCHNGTPHAGMGRQRAMRSAICRAPPATACTARSRPRSNWSRSACRPSSAPRAITSCQAQDGARRGAHAGARRVHVVQLLP